MEKNTVYEILCRSLTTHELKNILYVGDSDAEVHKYLIDHFLYSDVTIKKVEDVNPSAKRLLTRIPKIEQRIRSKIVSDGNLHISAVKDARPTRKQSDGVRGEGDKPSRETFHLND